MKTAAKVFIIIGMVTGFWMIAPIIVGAFALDKLNSAKSASELQTMAILTLIFCSLLGGVFMLLIKDEELSSAPAKDPNVIDVKNEYTNADAQNDTANHDRSTDAIAQLVKLKELKDKGILTEEEFAERKAKILKEL